LQDDLLLNSNESFNDLKISALNVDDNSFSNMDNSQGTLGSN